MTDVGTIDWLALFPGLSGLDPDSAQALRASARIVRHKAGTVLFHPGELCRNFLLLVQGRVSIRKSAPSGREMVLYRVLPGESCILTTSFLMAGEAYAVEGVAESDLCAVVIPDETFHRLLAASPVFRRFVFGACGQRLADLLCLVQDLAFERIDIRLAERLLARAENGLAVCTHQDLAEELGSAREVVSRQLKAFERRGWIRLARGRIHILAPQSLHTMIEAGPNGV